MADRMFLTMLWMLERLLALQTQMRHPQARTESALIAHTRH